MTGFASTAIGMGLENAWEGTNYSFGDIFVNSLINGAISGLAGGVFEKLPIKGLTTGRGSYSAITKQITTKFFNGSIRRISYNTFSKILTYNMLESLVDSSIDGIRDAYGF